MPRLNAYDAANRPRLQPRALAVPLAAALALVAGCSSSSKSTPTPSPTTPAPSSAPATSSAASATPTPVASPTPTPIAGAAACASEHLALQAGQTQGAAGSLIATYILRNAGTAPCTLFGFPGVSLLNAAGQQVGAAANRQGSTFPQFTLQPGQVGSFRVQIAHAGCPPTSPQSQNIRVFPPNQTSPLTAPLQVAVCTAPSVTAVQPGIIAN